jgi:hypothetical protein
MVDTKLVQLVLLLHQKTLSGSIDWKMGRTPNNYEAVLGGFTIRLSSQHGNYEEEALDYFMEVVDADDLVVESVSDPELHEVLPADLNAYTIMREMYTRASRVALGADKAVEAILKALGNE